MESNFEASPPATLAPPAPAPAAEAKLGDFSTNRRVLLLSGMAVVVGVISSLAAYGLLWLIIRITDAAFHLRFAALPGVPRQNHLGCWVVAVPVAGALIVGLMARYGSEKIRGHGIPEALESILLGRSIIEPKVAVLKPLSAAISIGTGGPFGAEGPIIMTGAAFGSLFAQQFHLSAAERKALLVAGAAGGMSAVFATPVAAVLLAVELLLFEWKPRSLIPVGVASVVAWVMRGLLLGPGPIFLVPAHPAPSGQELLFALGLARRGQHVTCEYSIDLLEMIRVRDVMDQAVSVIPATMKLTELSGRLVAGDAALTQHQGILLVDARQRLAGIITRGDVVRALQRHDGEDLTVAEAGSTRLVVAYPDEPLQVALTRMLERNLGRLPVVDWSNPTRVVGYLGRSAILAARMRLHQEEHLRERRQAASAASTLSCNCRGVS